MTTYLRRLFVVPSEQQELLVAALWEAGTVGIEEPDALLVTTAEQARIVAYFATAAPLAAELPSAARLVEEAPVVEQDWLATHREHAQPLEVGERFVLDPREPDAPAPDVPASRTLLRVPARSAFGTGSHATTRLVLRLLERKALAGLRVLDIGTGSGVLAMAAMRLGAARALGLDVDLAAALLAGQHARLNDTVCGFWAGSLAALSARARFDVVVVNALPHEIASEAPAIVAALAPAGRLVVSGVPLVERDRVLAAWSERGLVLRHELVEEEWVAWTMTTTR